MNQIARIGLDIAKRWFQIHAVDESGREVLNPKLPRDKVLGFLAALPACDVALESCSSSHYWGREIGRLGHRVSLISPNYVKPYLKGSLMRMTPARSAKPRRARTCGCSRKERGAASCADAAYIQAVADRPATGVANSLRSQLAEFGVIERKGIENVGELVRMLDEDDEELAQAPAGALTVMKILADQLRAVDAHLSAIDEEIAAWQRESAAAQALKTIPGVGGLISAALAAHVPDPSMFRSGRDFAAWLGLVPRQNSSGGKERLGKITKQGNPYLRRLLVLGATASLRCLHKRPDPLAAWTKRLLERRPARLVTVALANKLARIAWAIMTAGELFRSEAPTAPA